MQNFIFNGKSSAMFEMKVGGVNNFGAPERIVIEYEIPGKNGTEVEDTGAFRNFVREYNCAVMHDRNLEQTMSAIKAWLLQDGNYHRLEDSYAPDIYRMARVTGEIPTIAIGSNVRSVSFPITFSCCPEKYLKTGEVPIETNQAGVTLRNPTDFAAHPLIRVVNRSGQETRLLFYEEGSDNQLSKGIITISHTSQRYRPILIDCKTTEAWFDDSLGGNANMVIDCEGDLTLKEETRIVGEENKEMSVSITPRWWRL